jgi:uncharacterized repeat protein (TIGR01451 family)
MTIIKNSIATLFLGVILGLTVYGAGNVHQRPLGGGVAMRSPGDAPVGGASAGSVYHHMPLYFEANRGQAPAPVRFLSRGPDYDLYLTPGGPVLALHRGTRAAVIRMHLAGGNADPQVTGHDRQPGTVSYLHGKDPGAWQEGVPVYRRVAYPSVYPGIDLVFHGRGDQLEYDFTVDAGADPGAIRMDYSGVRLLRIDAAGRLHLVTDHGEVIQHPPVAYQVIDGERHGVASRYVLGDTRQVGFAVSDYDRRRALIIDPVLSFSGYFGGSGDERGFAVASDAAGSVYITGRTESVDFPATAGDTTCGTVIDCTQNTVSDTFDGTVLNAKHPNMWQATGTVTQNDALTVTTAAAPGSRAGVTLTPTLPGNLDVHVSLSGLNESDKSTGMELQLGAKTYDFTVTSSGTTQSYTVSDGGGCSASTPIAAAAVDFEDTAELRVVRTGTTLTFMAYSLANALVKTYELIGSCAGVATADATLQLFVESAAAAAKTSGFDDFYATESTGSPDAFVMRLDNGGSTLGYAAYLGGGSQDEGLGIAVDTTGNAYVTGRTYSADFPVTAGAFATQCPDTNGDGQCDGGGDAFIARLDAAGAVSYATYLGGCFDDAANAIAVDGSDNVYVAGYSESAQDSAASSTAATCVNEFPLKNAIQTTNKGRKDAFVAKLNPAGAGAADLVYSTFLGGAYADEALGIAVSSGGVAYVTGYTASSDFPVVPASGAYQTTLGNDVPGATAGYDAFVTKINAAGNALVYSTYLGGSAYEYGQGIAVDATGNAYVAGWTSSADFPTASPLQATNDGSYDAFVAKINLAGSALVYSTYLGGLDTDAAQGIAVDAGGNALITGYTTSRDFLISLLRDVQPNLATPLTTLNNLDNYVMNNLSTDDLAQALVQIDPTLSLTAMKALSRSDLIGKIFDEFYGTPNKEGLLVSKLHAIQTGLAGSSDAVLVKLNAAGSTVTEATYLGGGDEDYGTGIALDSAGNPYITGYTVTNDPDTVSGRSEAQNFPATDATNLGLKTYGADNNREEDLFLAKVDDGDVDVSVTLTDNAAGAVDPGSNVTYTATVSNVGAVTANGVVLTETLQIGLNLVSAAAGQGSCAPSAADITTFTNVVTCRLGSLAGGASTTVTVVATASPAGTTLGNEADVSVLATNTGNRTATTDVAVGVNVPLQAARTCDISSTKPTGCSVPELGGADPGSLAALAASLMLYCAVRRRRARRSHGS